ncbi:FIST signal transduction protein [Oceanirhabdus seepicola]|uniref:FIST C-terminal domain-containing protein n=1 Tax=Oceanirhabdus seepicola TaxID=2828781 RepID=A0A9J6NYT9_9CLOT|nr:FIST N-terminal domain-containing protein [Oceanirhabdus seepicola]MCM1988789.1 FIST C-terminal domain-containing protein [Oceanirhabdus seepicola]
MMNSKIYYSKNKNTKEAVKEIIEKIDQRDIKLVMFFASTTYDFEFVSKEFNNKFSDCEVTGTTTSGELCNTGFGDNGLLAISIASKEMKVKSILIEDGDKHPILYKDKIYGTMKEIGLNPSSLDISNKGFGIGLFNGLFNMEEKLLSVIYSVIKDSSFKILGGTAGDDLKFENTLISYKGKVINNGCVMTFVKTDAPFHIQKENIFTQSGITMTATKVDVRKRIIYEFNGRAAATEYARVLGIQENKLDKHFTINPLGRLIGDEVFIATPFQINSDKSITLYSQILPNAIVDVLELKDPEKCLHETLSEVKEKIPNLKLVIAFNCILRTLYFKEKKITGNLTNIFNEYVPSLCGFTSYGEQFGKMHVNQTLTILALGGIE